MTRYLDTRAVLYPNMKLWLFWKTEKKKTCHVLLNPNWN